MTLEEWRKSLDTTDWELPDEPKYTVSHILNDWEAERGKLIEQRNYYKEMLTHLKDDLNESVGLLRITLRHYDDSPST